MKNFEEENEVKHFDKMADHYDGNYNYNSEFFEYKKNKKVTDCVKYLKVATIPIRNILEIGSGTGEYTQELVKAMPKANIWATDISSGMLKIAEKKIKGTKRIKFKKMSAYDLKFRDKTFDAVVGFYILHHLNDLKKVFAEIQRVLKPNGVAFFIEPNLLNPAVFAIKNVPYLKKMAGDSPNETAINLFTIEKYLNSQLKISSTVCKELLWPVSFLNEKQKINLDLLIKPMEKWPVFKFLGGSVEICLVKKA